MCRCIMWNCLSIGIENKSLWYDVVTHYQWHSIIQMGSSNGDCCCRCCCFASSCLTEHARSPLMVINCLLPWGTEAIPRVRCSRPNGSEQKERWGRFGPTLFGVGVHPPLRDAPDRWGQLSPLLYNVYIDDLNHHLQATGVGWYMIGAWVNSVSYADDMLLLAPRVTALQTLLELCRAHMLDLMTLYATQRKQYECWSDKSNHMVATQQESCSEMRNLALLRSFVT